MESGQTAVVLKNELFYAINRYSVVAGYLCGDEKYALQRFNADMDRSHAVIPKGFKKHTVSIPYIFFQIIIPPINIYWRPRVQKEPTSSKGLALLEALIILIAMERWVITALQSTCSGIDRLPISN